MRADPTVRLLLVGLDRQVQLFRRLSYGLRQVFDVLVRVRRLHPIGAVHDVVIRDTELEWLVDWRHEIDPLGFASVMTPEERHRALA